MTNIQVICDKCGVVKENVERSGELVEPHPMQKAEIIAQQHQMESGLVCWAYVQTA